MAKKADGSVILDTKINTEGFGQGVVNLQSQLGKLSGVAKKLGGAISLAFGVRQLVQFGKEAINIGSDLQEVQNVVDVTFGSLSGSINDFSQAAIKQFGLSELSAKQYTSTLGAMLKSMGMTEAQAADMSMTMAGLAGDMASFYNLAGDEAFSKIRAGISGETEPLKQLGINLSVANLEAYALSQGITKSYNAMTEQEKALLRYNYLLSVTSDAQGDFARTSGSWANQTKILAEQFNSLKASIGMGLINVFTPVIRVINTVLTGLQAVANAFNQITAALFGKAGKADADQTAKAIAGVASGYKNAAEGAEQLAGATEKAGKAAKKYIAGFDEIQKIGEKENGSGGSAGGGGYGGGYDVPTINVPAGNVEDTISPQIARIVEKIKDLLAPLQEISFDPLKDSLKNLGDSFLNLGGIIGTELEWAWFNILVPLAKWTIEEAGPATLNLFADAIRFVTAVLKPLLDGLAKLWGWLQPIFKFIGDTVLVVLEKWRQLFQKLAKVFEEKGPEISGIIANIGEVVALIWTLIRPILEQMRAEWGHTFDFLGDIASSTIGYILDVLYGLTEFLLGQFTGNWDRSWAGVCKIFKGSWDYIRNLFDDLFDFFGFEFNFSDIENGFKAMVNSVIGFLNKLISGIVSGVNTAIRAINRLSINIPQWVPGIGGSKLGFNLRTITAPKIPYLAKGAVIPPNAPFMAVLGDQRRGTNIEAPLDTIKQAVAMVLEDYVAANLAGHEATVSVLREILEAVLGIEIGDDVIGKAAQRYNHKMSIIRGGGA